MGKKYVRPKIGCKWRHKISNYSRSQEIEQQCRFLHARQMKWFQIYAQYIFGCRDSIVGTLYGLDDEEFELAGSDRQTDRHTGYESHPISCKIGTDSFFLGGRSARARHWPLTTYRLLAARSSMISVVRTIPVHTYSVPAWHETGHLCLYLLQLFGKSCSFRDNKVIEEAELSLYS